MIAKITLDISYNICYTIGMDANIDRKKKKRREITWTGEKNRETKVYLPCSCGCDRRDGKKFLAYISGSNAKGEGFTIYLQSQKELKQARANINRVIVEAMTEEAR